MAALNLTDKQPRPRPVNVTGNGTELELQGPSLDVSQIINNANDWEFDPLYVQLGLQGDDLYALGTSSSYQFCKSAFALLPSLASMCCFRAAQPAPHSLASGELM